MNDFGLLVGHLVGDFLSQSDWMARNKTNSWEKGRRSWWLGHLACLVHCLVYALSVWQFAIWLPWWAVLIVFLSHFPIDRWRLARRLMKVTGQEEFATGPLSPWSIITVDQVLHLMILYGIAKVVLLLGA
jgi:hypothetical protein